MQFFHGWETIDFGAYATGVLWGGLAIVTIALLILMRTRWGQARPLSKCVALSVFAHVLLMAYAYGTIFDTDTPPPAEVPAFRLSEVQTRDEEVNEDDQNEPWEQLLSDAPLAPEVAGPAPTLTPSETRVARAAVPVESQLQTPHTPGGAAPLQEPTKHAESSAASVKPVLPQTTPAPAVALKAPPTKHDRLAAPVVGPVASRPRTPQPRMDQPQIARAPSPKARNLVESSADMQRLADTSSVPNPADLMQATIDDLSDARNNHTQRTSDGAPQPGELQEAALQLDRGAEERLLASTMAPDIRIRAGENDTPDIAQVRKAKVQRRLGDGAQVPTIYTHRAPENRLQTASAFGGDEKTESAVEAALLWLAANQNADGAWSPRTHEGGQEKRVLGHDRGGAGANAETGMTGLALLSFLAAGHTHLEGRHRESVQHGLEYLLTSQTPDGNLAGKARLFARMYCHGMASLALSEAYAMTGDHRLRTAVQKAVKYTLASQHPTDGGWRYQPGDRGDLSQFGWQVMSLRSAEIGGIEISDSVKGRMATFLDGVSSGPHKGLASYRPGERASRVMTAEAMVCRFFLEQEPTDHSMIEAARFIAEETPGEGKPNLYYWYYASLAAFQMQGDLWNAWSGPMKEQLVKRQETEGSLAGSWSPNTVWGSYGGRVYSTAMSALCLEVYYRYLPLYGGRLARVNAGPIRR